MRPKVFITLLHKEFKRLEVKSKDQQVLKNYTVGQDLLPTFLHSNSLALPSMSPPVMINIGFAFKPKVTENTFTKFTVFIRG